MKAWVLHDIGDIRFEEKKMPEPGEGEVLVRVKAAGVCGSDIPRIYQTGAHRMPLIPGHEFSGVVEKVGAGVVLKSGSTDASGGDADDSRADDLIGKRVSVFPLIPCRKCEPCRNGHYEMCRNYDYTGSRRDGAFAEYVSVPADNLIEIPDGVSFEAAAMAEPMAVAVHAMRIGLIDIFPKRASNTGAGCELYENTEEISGKKQGLRIVVCGLGTIGLLIVQFLLDAGFEDIYLIGNKDFQFDLAGRLGVGKDRICDSRSENVCEWIEKRCDGADVFFECVGKNETLIYGVSAAAPGAHVVTVGNPSSDMTLPRDVYWKILRNQLKVSGTWNSSFTLRQIFRADHNTVGQKLLDPADSLMSYDPVPDDWQYVMDRLKNGSIDPEILITHSFLIDELEKGFLIMRDKMQDYVKVMAKIN
ncbi:MAG: galactitol-1-phosphate 5-dehydrogenase [Eubacterium sp.]|nr:galactitol-1-phosphate 5-dehydrogenase [Eubacterium sp.]